MKALDACLISPCWSRHESTEMASYVATPLHWEAGGETIDFDIAMDTHSVDLSFDLAPISILTTDTGINVPALCWQAPGGGHHVTGRLSFPTQVDGKTVLKDVSLLTLRIENIDVPERVLTWQKVQVINLP